ncbi:MAG: polysaccharide biosynthesis protein [Promethearchaeota archaeon]
MLDDKTLLITGGTGTIGKALLKKILEAHNPKVIRIFSRDETKQYFLNLKYKGLEDKVRFFIGDIRDKDRVRRAMENVDIVFHLAALKHVESCEYNPFEAIKTNVIGLQNLIDVSIEKKVKKFVYTSTDKAATPCNIMGVTKLLGEKLITAANYYKGVAGTLFYSVRFGNVLGSRGSLVPTIEKQIRSDLPITVTHTDMTRYIMGLNHALQLILDSLNITQGGEVFVLKMQTVKIIDLIEVLIEHYSEKYNKKAKDFEMKEIGILAGEKLYEELFSIEEADRTYELDNMYLIIPQIEEYIYKIDLSKYSNIRKFDKSKPFCSKNGPFLKKEEILNYLLDQKIIS